MEIDITEIISRLKKAVEDSGLTYRQLSAKTNIPSSTLQRWATGQVKRIPIDDLQIVANACHVDAGWILGWTDDKAPPENERIQRIIEQLKTMSPEALSLVERLMRMTPEQIKALDRMLQLL